MYAKKEEILSQAVERMWGRCTSGEADTTALGVPSNPVITALSPLGSAIALQLLSLIKLKALQHPNWPKHFDP